MEGTQSMEMQPTSANLPVSVSTTAHYSRLSAYASSDASSVATSPQAQSVTIELRDLPSSAFADSATQPRPDTEHRSVSVPRLDNSSSHPSSQISSPNPQPLHANGAGHSDSTAAGHPDNQPKANQAALFTTPELALSVAAHRISGAVKTYFKRYLGTKAGAFPTRPSLTHLCGSWVAAFIGIGIVAYMHYESGPGDHEALLGSFGAVSILTYGSFDSPFAQPRNVLISHILASIIGVAFNNIVPQKWFSCALSVATALTAMQITRTVHPPAGATAVLATLLNKTSFMFVLYPVLLGTVILVGVALVVNNFHKQYPLYWLRPKRSTPVSTIPTIVSAPHHHNDSLLCSPFSSNHHHFSNKEHQINTLACFQSPADFAYSWHPPAHRLDTQSNRAASPLPDHERQGLSLVVGADDGAVEQAPAAQVPCVMAEDEAGSELEVDVEDQFEPYAEPVDTETYSLESPQNRMENWQ